MDKGPGDVLLLLRPQGPDRFIQHLVLSACCSPQSLLCESAWTAIAEYHRQGGLSNRYLFPHSSDG